MEFPDIEIREFAIGEIRSHGVNDIAVVFNRIGKPTVNWIALLSKEKNGSYRIDHTTKEINPGGGNDDFSVEIRNSALFVRTSFPGQSIAEADEYQFKYRGGIFRLIGVKMNLFSHAADDSSYRYTLSTNLLTGEKNEFIEDDIDGKRKRREVKSLVPIRPPIKLEDFDFVVGLRAELRPTVGRDFEIR